MADKATRERAVGAEGLTADADGGPWLGDAIHFFLSAKRAGGRSTRTIDDYGKKLELFQRWLAVTLGGGDAVDAPYIDVGADEVEAYVVYLKDERGMADSSRKNHLAVLRSFFQTVSRRMKLPDPTSDLDEVRFHRMYTITDAGEAQLGFWAKSLGQYQQSMDAFFRLYAGKPPHTDKN